MPLRDPVAVYNAASNIEAGFVCDALIAGGVEAYVMEDVSQVGTWVGGLVPEIHKPQVYVERSEVERATPILVEYERRAKELRATEGDGQPIDVECEECGGAAQFPAAQMGSVQSCPHCGAFVDVGGDESWDEDSESGDDDEAGHVKE